MFISGGKSGRRRIPGNIISFDEDDVSGRSEDGNGSIGRSSPLAHNTPPIEVGFILVLDYIIYLKIFVNLVCISPGFVLEISFSL